MIKLVLKYLCLVCAIFSQGVAQNTQIKDLLKQQRLIIIMFDGFGMSYYNHTQMPTLKKMAQNGLFKEVLSNMPTVTNANNTSICTSQNPNVHGITGNSYLSDSNQEEYMEDQHLVLSSTLFQKLNNINIQSALIASKKKSIGLLSAGTSIALSPELADSTWINRLGKAPSIYSPDVNYWSFNAALYILKNKPEIRCIYIHTTDYPMHMWAPEDSNSIRHLSNIDNYLKKITELAPDAIVMITADHDVNHKNKCIDIETALAEKNIKIKMAISAERDKYFKHHRGFGGTSYIYLNQANQADLVKSNLLKIKGIEKVLSRSEAANLFQLMPSRIGDLIALGDSLTVFGNLDHKSEEALPANYRSHGSEYERKVPLIIYNAKNLPPKDYFQMNYQITGWLFNN